MKSEREKGSETETRPRRSRQRVPLAEDAPTPEIIAEELAIEQLAEEASVAPDEQLAAIEPQELEGVEVIVKPKRVRKKKISVGIVETKETTPEITLSPEELNIEANEAHRVGDVWFNHSSALSLNRKQQREFEVATSSFSHLKDVISQLNMSQGSTIVFWFINGIGVLEPKFDKLCRRLVLKFLDRQPDVFDGLETIPFLKSKTNVTSLSFIGFVQLSGYVTEQRRDFYNFLAKSVESEETKNLNVYELIALWIKKEQGRKSA